MLELVFVIVVIGIISAMVIPRMDRDSIFEAANQVVKHIKYTQHLAMTEDVYDADTPTWWRRRWEIQLYRCGGYAIHSDADLNNSPTAAQNEAAFDPESKNKRIFVTGTCVSNFVGTVLSPGGDYDRANLAAEYDISPATGGGLAFAGCGAGLSAQISFDNLGRPYSSNGINALLQTPCNIVLTDGSANTVTVQIQPETGYACILNAGGNCI